MSTINNDFEDVWARGRIDHPCNLYSDGFDSDYISLSDFMTFTAMNYNHDSLLLYTFGTTCQKSLKTTSTALA